MSFLSKEQIIAKPGFNRWLAVPAALGIHLSIGQVYAFSVFKLPLTKVLGITQSSPLDWSQSNIGWVFSLAILFLGLTAAFVGKWAQKQGERKIMLMAATFFGGGFMIASLGIHLHILALMYVGYGVIGGIGLGLGYVAPVTMLMRWFPDRPGMATGLAIMGFGGGALIASPLALALMKFFSCETSNGVLGAFITMGVLYFGIMALASIIVRVPAEGWTPATKAKAAVAKTEHKAEKPAMDVSLVMRSPIFYVLWFMMCLNVTAGIGLIYQASPMLQELFPKEVTPEIAAFFVGVISLGNMLGRFIWSTLSDKLGRPLTFGVFFTLGLALYSSLNTVGATSYVYFMVACALIISMYGGTFSTIPVYLKDIFGMKDLGAIYGRILTAWSAGGVFGPKMFDYIRAHRIEAGATPIQAYSSIIYVICCLMVAGFILNLIAARALKKKA